MDNIEIHPAVDAAKKENHEKANRALRIRVIAASIAVMVLCLFGGLGLISWVLAAPLLLATGIWVAIWFGAWLQFKYAYGGGLLNGIK